MSYVAIAFPVSAGSHKERQAESLRRARRFAEAVGLRKGDVSKIRTSTYGCIMDESVDDDVLLEASKHDGKVLPFVERELPKVTEGSWVELKERVDGIRFEMSGTSASNPVEGSIQPGKYFVLGLQESEGSVFATLGRVDKLAAIGQRNGPGRYTYNVDIQALRESLSAPKAKVTKAASKTESAKPAAQAELQEGDRSLQILNFLLQDDPHVLAENRREEAKGKRIEEARAADAAKASRGEIATPELDDADMASLIEHAVNSDTKVTYTEEELKDFSGVAPAAAKVTESEEFDPTDILRSLGQDIDTGVAPAGEVVLEESASEEPSREEEVAEEETEVADQETTDEEGGLEEAMDPELFAEVRSIIGAMIEEGIDVDSMSDEELEEAMGEFLEALYEADDEESAEDGEEDDASADDAESEVEDAQDVQESEEPAADGEDDFEDEGFEATEK